MYPKKETSQIKLKNIFYIYSIVLTTVIISSYIFSDNEFKTSSGELIGVTINKDDVKSVHYSSNNKDNRSVPILSADKHIEITLNPSFLIQYKKKFLLHIIKVLFFIFIPFMFIIIYNKLKKRKQADNDSVK